MAKRLAEYCDYFNGARPHQGIGQKVPLGTIFSVDVDGERVVSIPILGGLHHEYARMAACRPSQLTIQEGQAFPYSPTFTFTRLG
jgi:hypothetical protein